METYGHKIMNATKSEGLYFVHPVKETEGTFGHAKITDATDFKAWDNRIGYFT